MASRRPGRRTVQADAGDAALSFFGKITSISNGLASSSTQNLAGLCGSSYAALIAYGLSIEGVIPLKFYDSLVLTAFLLAGYTTALLLCRKLLGADAKTPRPGDAPKA
jgi:hypothetical protein